MYGIFTYIDVRKYAIHGVSVYLTAIGPAGVTGLRAAEEFGGNH